MYTDVYTGLRCRTRDPIHVTYVCGWSGGYAAGLEGGGAPRRAYVEIIRDVIWFCLEGKTPTETRRGCGIDTAKMRHYVDNSLRDRL